MNHEDLVTCLSSEPHNERITDHITHFLGCTEFSERYRFLKDDNHPVWEREFHHYEHQGCSREEAQKLSRDKRKKWKSDCQSELRRLDFLRRKLSDDNEETHLLDSILQSGRAWRASDEYRNNIEHVKAWRAAKGKPKEDNRQLYKPGGNLSLAYNAEKDTDAHFMYFVDSKPEEEEMKPGIPVWDSFPNQKTTVDYLLHYGGAADQCLLFRGRLPQAIKYFHLPLNNMIVRNTPDYSADCTKARQKAISQYFMEHEPSLYDIRHEGPQQSKSNAASILSEAYWRGQLHGGRSITKHRSMRSFCDVVSSAASDIDNVPQNIVLFMPYIHWETSRNRERIAQFVEEIVYKRLSYKRRAQARDKFYRQKEREALKRPPRPQPTYHPPFTSKLGKLTDSIIHTIRRADTETKQQEIDDQIKLDSTSEELPSVYRQVRSRSRILTMGTLLQRLQLPIETVRMDPNGRPIIKNALGQYLLDAARLYEGVTNYRDKRLLQKYVAADPPLHPRRTLDQAYYWFLDKTAKRDRDQVVYRQTTPDRRSFHRYDPNNARWIGHEGLDEDEACDDCTSNIKKLSRLVMVDQLWMWVLDSKTIITCFPKLYGSSKHVSSGVHESIRLRVGEGRHKQIKSVYDLALIILEECSNTFFYTDISDKQPQMLDAFSEAIGSIMHRHTIGFDRLWRWTDDARRSFASRTGLGSLDIKLPPLDINSEGALQEEIKDIIEELGIIISVYKEQRDVITQFVSRVKHILDPSNRFNTRRREEGPSKTGADTQRNRSTTQPMLPDVKPTEPDMSSKESISATQSEAEREETFTWFTLNAEELLTRVNNRIEQLEDLERSAEDTAKSVRDLLDLKSQQAGVVYTWQGMKQSEEATQQGRSIMIFTVVTIVFLPLSFMSSVFGMNAVDFSDGLMDLHDEFTYMFAISAGVIAVTLLLSFSQWTRSVARYIFERVKGTIYHYTGLYEGFLQATVPADELYLEAIKKTERLKDKQIQARLDQNRRKRRREEADRKLPRFIASDGRPGNRHAMSMAGRSNPPRKSLTRRRWWDLFQIHGRTEETMMA